MRRFDFFEVFRRELCGAVEIVVEAGLGGRTDAELGFRKEFEHGGGQQMRRRMAIDLERLRVFGGQDLKLRIVFEGAGQIVEFSVHARHDGVIRETGADGLGNIYRTGAV